MEQSRNLPRSVPSSMKSKSINTKKNDIISFPTVTDTDILNTRTHDPIVYQNQTYTRHEALRQAHLPILEGDLGLTNSNSVEGPAYIGCHALVLGRIDAVSTREKQKDRRTMRKARARGREASDRKRQGEGEAKKAQEIREEL